VFDRLLMVLFAPLWIPASLLAARKRRREIDAVLVGTSEQAWAHACSVWQSSGAVKGASHGPMLESAFEHDLAAAFAKRFPEASALAERSLLDTDPHVVAYAFKVLIRTKPLELSDLPPELLARRDRIIVFLGGSVASAMTLSDWIRQYFATPQTPLYS
jgi:hypothetical protein